MTDNLTPADIAGLIFLVLTMGGLIWWIFQQAVQANGRKLDRLLLAVDGIPPIREKVGFLDGQFKEMHSRIEGVANRYHELGNLVMHRAEIEMKIASVKSETKDDINESEGRLNSRLDKIEEKLDRVLENVGIRRKGD